MVENDIFKVIPNWLRYILAIPFGIICMILGYYLFHISNLWVASPDSLMVIFLDFIYNNSLNAIVIILSMDLMLPKHQFVFALIVSIIFCAIGFMSFGITIITQTCSVIFIIELILELISFIYSCYYTYKKYNIKE